MSQVDFRPSNLGKLSVANQTPTWNVLNMPANPEGRFRTRAFQFLPYDSARAVQRFGQWSCTPKPWPYPDTRTYTWHTYAVTIPIADLVTGTNVVHLGADQTW